MTRWSAFDRMAWCLGVSAMGLVGLVVVSLVGAFLMLLIQRPIHGPGHGSVGKAKSDIRALESALDEYSIANSGRFPETLGALVVPDENDRTFIDWTRIPKDAWGNDYLYDPHGSPTLGPRVWTLGRDGAIGGEGDDADIDNLSLREDR